MCPLRTTYEAHKLNGGSGNNLGYQNSPHFLKMKKHRLSALELKGSLLVEGLGLVV